MSKPLSIVVIGATGYTGQITCRHLHAQRLAGRGSSFGIAGRSEEKLKALQAELTPDIPSFVVDLANPASLDHVCQQASCIISCAGPFTKVGTPVVEACVRNGVHYVDSTGEFNFVRHVIERFHEEAVQKNVVLASCCGFDCVPSDVANYVLHREAPTPLKEIKCFYTLQTAGISSGTANSIGAVMEQMEGPDRSLCSLVPVDGAQPTRATTRIGMWREEGHFTGPYVMAGGNERIVRRSISLMGSKASYVEALSGGFFSILGSTLSLYAMGLVLAIGPLRRTMLRRLYPADSGIGPTDKKKKNAYYRCSTIGWTEDGRRVVVNLSHQLDMYDCTGIYLAACAESALALHAEGRIKPGALTPAVAFGEELVRRCIAGGMEMSCDGADIKTS